jgi:flagellar protein FlgJ
VSTPPTSKERAADIDAAVRAAQLAKLQQDYTRTNQTPLPQPPKSPQQLAADAAAQRRGQVIGEEAAKKEFSLPQTEQTAREALKLATQLSRHPGFEGAVGMPNPFKGGFGLFNIPGTPAADFMNLHNQALNQTFMTARESLKGAGAVTDFEGKKAENAMAAMKAATSETEYKRALQDYVDAIAAGVEIARKQSRMGAVPFTYDQLMAEKARRAASAGRK